MVLKCKNIAIFWDIFCNFWIFYKDCSMLCVSLVLKCENITIFWDIFWDIFCNFWTLYKDCSMLCVKYESCIEFCTLHVCLWLTWTMISFFWLYIFVYILVKYRPEGSTCKSIWENWDVWFQGLFGTVKHDYWFLFIWEVFKDFFQIFYFILLDDAIKIGL